MRDKLFRKKNFAVFSFEHETARVFDDMLKRSVPHYSEMHGMICDIAEIFTSGKGKIYDLGCSNGNLVAALLKRRRLAGTRVIGFDNSAAMLVEARKRLAKFPASRFRLLKKDLNCTDGSIRNAQVVVANLTLQFTRPERRSKLLREIYAGLNEGGVFIMTEKVLTPNSKTQALFTDLYHQFKGRNGYSPAEIYRKSQSLKNVLISCTVRDNLRLVKAAGFPIVEEFFRWFNFCGLMAFK